MNFTKVSENLKKLGYTVSCFENREAAAAYLKEQITGTTVGIGGSATVGEMGLYDILAEQNEVYWHARPRDGVTADEMRMLARNTEVYISSVNGLAETGEIVNIDGSGNRVAEIMYGHKKVYLIIGENKLAPDYDKALYRARNIAAPLNAKRLNRKTPCAVKGDRCYNCSSPERICRGLSVLWTCPSGSSYEIILIGESLGF